MAHGSCLLSFAAAAAICAAAGAQTTRPAGGVGQPAELAELTITVWTCPEHPKLRQPDRGVCPLCEKALTKAEATVQGTPEAWGYAYPLETCPVSGQELGSMGPPVVWVHEGREVRFCCAGCVPKFEADPQKFLDKIDEAIIEQQLPWYPMTTCPISGEPLDDMGEPVNFVYHNRLVRFCCNGCKRKFKKDPALGVNIIDAAVLAAQGPDYPLTSCPISGETLGAMGEPVDYVIADRLVRFCCAGCVGPFHRAPAVHLAALNKAWAGHEDAGHDDDADDDHDDGHGGHDHDHDH